MFASKRKILLKHLLARYRFPKLGTLEGVVHTHFQNCLARADNQGGIQHCGSRGGLCHAAFFHPDGWLFPRKRIAGSRSEEHTSELQSLMRISYAVFCLKKKN